MYSQKRRKSKKVILKVHAKKLWNLRKPLGFIGMNKNWSVDSLGLRLRVSGLHQTWKWLHQTIALHEYLISVTSTDTAVSQKCLSNQICDEC